MAFVSSAIPNLIGGVSQQPAAIRALNCSTALINSWCDVVTGLSTRPAGKYVGALGIEPTSGKTVATHIINKADGDYIVAVYDGTVKVAKLGPFGIQTVTVIGSATNYLAGVDDAAANIGFVTVGDTTFIYNKTKVVTKTTTNEGTGYDGTTDGGVVRKNPNKHASVWVKQGGNAYSNFTVYYNGTEIANASSGQYAEADDTAADISGDLTAAGKSNTRPGRTIVSVQLTTEGDFMTGRDDYGDQAMLVYNDKIEEFADLPNIDRDGRLVMVENGIEEDADDYWVWFTKERWEETYGWSAYEVIDATTMPIILVHNGGTAWDLKYTVWPGREVGDADSNPTPSFVGNTIRYMMLHKGRMVILSDENFIASRISNFENYYRQTCTQLLDDDPIDIASANSRGAPLNFAKEFAESLLLFTAYDQFKVEADSEGLLSPNTVTMKRVNAYNNSPNVEPNYVGPNVAFVDDFGSQGFAALREYQVERVFGNENALPITDPVPEFIPTGVYKVVGSSTYNNLVVASKADRTSLWLYNYYFNNEGKVQSAWQRWTILGTIYSIDYSRDKLIATVAYDGDLHVLSFVFDAGADSIMDKSSILLDYGLEETGVTVSYSAVTGDTTVTLPYAVSVVDEPNVRLTVSPTVPGAAVPTQTYIPSDVAGAVLTFSNVDLSTSQFLVGFRYQFSWTPSPIYMRDKNLVAIQDGRLQLRRIALLYHNSGPFQTAFTPNKRETYISNFTAFVLGGYDELGELSLDSGEFRVAVNGAGEFLDLVVTSWTPWRVRFSTLEWEGSWRPKKRRM